MRIFKKTYKYFDPLTATAGALVLGGIVFWINFDHGTGKALIAAGKQGLYTFFAGGFIMKLCENIALYFNKKNLALFLAILIPSIIAIGLTYLLHTIKGTPHPLASTVPTMILAPMGFGWWAVRAVRGRRLAVHRRP
jgi:hypothetical protein